MIKTKIILQNIINNLDTSAHKKENIINFIYEYLCNKNIKLFHKILIYYVKLYDKKYNYLDTDNNLWSFIRLYFTNKHINMKYIIKSKYKYLFKTIIGGFIDDLTFEDSFEVNQYNKIIKHALQLDKTLLDKQYTYKEKTDYMDLTIAEIIDTYNYNDKKSYLSFKLYYYNLCYLKL